VSARAGGARRGEGRRLGSVPHQPCTTRAALHRGL
jgi:hypothetical protein